MTQDREKALRDALKCARIKLARYREQHGDAFIGGVAAEYDATVKLIDRALAMQEPASEPSPCEHCRDAYQAGVDFAMGAIPASEPTTLKQQVAELRQAWKDLGCDTSASEPARDPYKEVFGISSTASEPATASAPSCCVAQIADDLSEIEDSSELEMYANALRARAQPCQCGGLRAEIAKLERQCDYWQERLRNIKRGVQATTAPRSGGGHD